MIHSFLLAGQSNMAGRGIIGQVPPISDERLLVLRNGRWQPMYQPVNGDRPFSGVCLAESFALRYAQEHGVQVGLIPCADGGASLLQWREGGLLFDHALYQARLANRTSTVAGILWHQGEAECAPENYPLAEARLRALIAAFRREPCLAEAPFILGGLGDFLPLRKETPNLRNAPRVNAALQAVADDAQRIGFVSAQGLSSNPDLLHFNAPSLREFGLRYYAVFQRLEDKGRVFLEKSAPVDAVRTEMELL